MKNPTIIRPDRAFALYNNGLCTAQELYQYEQAFFAWYDKSRGSR